MGDVGVKKSVRRGKGAGQGLRKACVDYEMRLRYWRFFPPSERRSRQCSQHGNAAQAAQGRKQMTVATKGTRTSGSSGG